MNSTHTINQEVNVTELYFSNVPQVRSFPRRMEFNGRQYTFMDGLRYLVRKGQQLIQVFDMTDGTQDYRLQFDASQKSWTLVDITNRRILA